MEGKNSSAASVRTRALRLLVASQIDATPPPRYFCRPQTASPSAIHHTHELWNLLKQTCADAFLPRCKLDETLSTARLIGRARAALRDCSAFIERVLGPAVEALDPARYAARHALLSCRQRAAHEKSVKRRWLAGRCSSRPHEGKSCLNRHCTLVHVAAAATNRPRRYYAQRVVASAVASSAINYSRSGVINGGASRGEKEEEGGREEGREEGVDTGHSAHVFCRHGPVHEKVAAVDVACLTLQKVFQGIIGLWSARQLPAVAIPHDQVHAARIPLLYTQQYLGEAHVAWQGWGRWRFWNQQPLQRGRGVAV